MIPRNEFLSMISAAFLIIAANYNKAAAVKPAAAEEIEYFAVFMEGKKVGHAIQSRSVSDGQVRTSEEISITVNRANVAVTIAMKETGIETARGEPLGFEVTQQFGTMAMKTAGVVDKQGKVSLTATSMGAEQKSEFQWPQGAVMAEGLRLLALKKGLKEGIEYSVKIFSAGIMQAVDAHIRIGPKQDVDLLGRVVALREVITTLNMPGAGEIVTTGYVDEDLRVQKSTMPVAGIQVELLACAKEFALGQNDVLELIDKLFLASPQPLNNVGSAKSITYHVSPAGEAADFRIPSDDNQKAERLSNGNVIVTVEPIVAPKDAKFPYKGSDPAALEALKPTRYVESDQEVIIELARQAVGNTKDAAEAARRIEAFVADYITYKSLSIGYASAAEVAISRQGDCTEHAVLTAALCRAVGIPAQVVTGVAYVSSWRTLQNGFGGHAWTQVYLAGKWVGLDASFKSAGFGGYDAGHIALATGNGNPEDFLNLINTIGQFKIYKVVVK